jgi:hypothetical protein
MKKAFCLLIIFSLTASTSLFAQDKAAPQPKKPTEKKLEQLRDPFWPLNWYPANWGANVDVIEQQKTSGRWKKALRRIEISSIGKSADGKFFAYIKGRGVVEAGDILQIRYGGAIYKWKIKAITKSGIVPVRLADSSETNEKK